MDHIANYEDPSSKSQVHRRTRELLQTKCITLHSDIFAEQMEAAVYFRRVLAFGLTISGNFH